MTERQKWQNEVRAKHAERRLPPPVLDGERAVRVKADHLPVSQGHPVKLLRVETDYFVAGAVWEKIGGLWSCTKAAPILKWMLHRNLDQIHLALLRMGATWKFTPLDHGQPHEVTA